MPFLQEKQLYLVRGVLLLQNLYCYQYYCKSYSVCHLFVSQCMSSFSLFSFLLRVRFTEVGELSINVID